MRKVDNFYIPDGLNGDAELGAFREYKNSVSPNNFGLIRLDGPVILDGSKF